MLWYFRPSFVNCCPSPLLSGSNLPPPLPCVNIGTLYTRLQCERGWVWGPGPWTDKQLPQSPFTGQFF